MTSCSSELQSDHRWCEKLNECIENFYIPIPKILLKDGAEINLSITLRGYAGASETTYDNFKLDKKFIMSSSNELTIPYSIIFSPKFMYIFQSVVQKHIKALRCALKLEKSSSS